MTLNISNINQCVQIVNEQKLLVTNV
jgi:hypothetical protein